MTTPTTTPRPQIGTTLLEDGWVTQEQLDLAVRESTRTKNMLGQSLISLGFITEKVLAHYLAEGTQTGMVELANTIIEQEILNLVPYDLAIQLQVLPVSIKGKLLTLAVADPLDIIAVDTVESHTGLNVSTKTAPAQELVGAIERHYAHRESINQLLDELLAKGISDLGEDGSREAPMIRLCNQLITAGIQAQATDIHVEPDEKYLRIRMRKIGRASCRERV